MDEYCYSLFPLHVCMEFCGPDNSQQWIFTKDCKATFLVLIQLQFQQHSFSIPSPNSFVPYSILTVHEHALHVRDWAFVVMLTVSHYIVYRCTFLAWCLHPNASLCIIIISLNWVIVLSRLILMIRLYLWNEGCLSWWLEPQYYIQQYI